MTGGNRIGTRSNSVVIGVIVALSLFVTGVSKAETTIASNTPDAALMRELVQSNQQLQEQQQSVLRRLDQASQEAEALAKRNNEAVDARLRRIEDSVNVQRQRELENLQQSHRFTLIMIGIFAGVGFFGMLFIALLLLRTMNRRNEVMLAQFTGQPLAAGFAPAALASGETQLVAPNRVEQSTARFLNTIDRLEKRIHELEDTTEITTKTVEPDPKKKTETQPPDAEKQPEAAELKAVSELEPTVARVKSERAERDARIALLLGKGQALLNLQQADNALACFDEVIALDSTNAEAFVRKGIAQERLGRLDEAIDSYDRAIALDDSMTMAYLSKGGVFNRLERYGEALQCYEQALRVQKKPSVA
ncbi:MAG TPA: tetratricopeptide repeat protein [Verrucomicrobiae bacterium]|nr:tetratricopeptide repeat protein [Verrucomicrobiae bacterium]